MSITAKIHVLKKQAGLSDENYRDLLIGLTGKRSSKDLGITDAHKVITKLQALAGGAARTSVSTASRASGPFASKLQALWMTLHDLDVIQDRRDNAMMAFVRRQTGVDHTRFLREPADAARAIEALKKMAERAGVEWPNEKGHRKPADIRRAVILAQISIIRERYAKHAQAGAIPPSVDEASNALNGMRDIATVAQWTPLELLAVQTMLGRVVRAMVSAPR